MKVSIVTISYNQADFLERCVESVLAQENADIEYIVVDPGSTDGSREIIDRYRDRIAHVLYEPDAGPADGLNKGFALASGEVMGFLNSDDVLRPGAVSQLLRAWPRGADVVSGRGEFIDADDRVLSPIVPSRLSRWTLAYGAATVFQQGTFFRASIFRAVGGFNPENRTCWDGELFADMALAGARFAVVDVDVAGFRLHPAGISGSNRLEAQYRRDGLRLFEKLVGRPRRRLDDAVSVLARGVKYLREPSYLGRVLAARRRHAARVDGALAPTSVASDSRQAAGPPKVLHLITTLDPTQGGPVTGLRAISNCYPKTPLGCEIATLDAPDAPWLGNWAGLPVHVLGPARGHYAYSARLVPWLRTNAWRYRAVVVHGLWNYVSFAAWQALRGGATPYYVFTHGMLDPWFKRRYPLKHLKKWLYWPWAQYPALRDAAAVLFTAEQERLDARKSFWLYRAREIVTGYGITAPGGDAERQREAFLSAFPALRGQRLILFLGRVHEKKGCDILIRAFARVAPRDPSLRLVMAGPAEPAYARRLREMTDREGMAERVVWTGMLAGDQKWGAYRCAEAFALPSHQENFGLAVAEAMACGSAVLISDRINIWREVQDSGAGLIGHDDVESFSAVLERWEDLGPDGRAAMRAQGEPGFRRYFSMEKAFDRLVQLILTVDGRHTSR